MVNLPTFEPEDRFSFQINRSERTKQARWLVPLLASDSGLSWFLGKLNARDAEGDAAHASAFHLCYPLRDMFTADYYKCVGRADLEGDFISYYNNLFGLPEEFGADDVWRTKPGSRIRHPGAPGRAGWHEGFLKKHVHDPDLYEKARNARRMLGTEADVLILTPGTCVLVECKFKSALRDEQYGRHQMMGEALASRLGKEFHFGLVVENERDPDRAKIDAPYVLWSEIEAQVGKLA